MRRRVRARIAGCLAAFAMGGCGQATDDAANHPYVVTVDVTPQIRAFGEETASADEAGEQLVAFGEAAVPALAAALEREPLDVRKKAIEVLAAIGTPAAVPALLRAAQWDADETARGDALRALGAIGDERARPVLEAALRDERLHVRAGGVIGCATLCGSSVDIERLVGIAIGEAHRGVAHAARTTLGSLRRVGTEQDGTVRRAIDARRPLLQSGAPDERALVALLVSDVDEAAGAMALAASIEQATPPLQRQGSWRLGQIGGRDAVAPLTKLLASPDRAVRLYAADALVNLRARGVDGATKAVDEYAGPKPAAPLGPPEY